MEEEWGQCFLFTYTIYIEGVPMADTKIQVMDNGPILVSGGSFEVQDASGGVFSVEEGKTVALCRCGQAEDKPFCDGIHKSCGFESQVKAE